MIERTNFIGYPVDNITKNELLEFVINAINHNKKYFIAVQNANKMYLSKKNVSLKAAIESAKIILPENAINIGMWIIGKPLKERNIGGVHAMEELLKLANKYSYSIYLLGATNNCLDLLVKKILSEYQNIKLVGYQNGYFSLEDEPVIVEKISKLKPNFLFVGMGSPKQEIFIENNINKMNANICMGVGGSFNVIAGLEKPAPKWTKYGFEWIFRSIQDPKKISRYIKINSFYCFEFIRYYLKKINDSA